MFIYARYNAITVYLVVNKRDTLAVMEFILSGKQNIKELYNCDNTMIKQ